MNKLWLDDGWSDYEDWVGRGDWKTVKRINKLIDDINMHPFTGLGKPEPLKHELSGLWSRRITQEHRLIYTINNNTIQIFSCRDH
ncbi:Txe/YoeB family addiction module toxin [Lacticaseibacillus sharpeae]|uniref:Txe/YoeB family addiction module toxin n=1 Tax=Lacticaseibacillus sharpeae TaxID=1626 RepID=UPI0006D2C7F4|nr:Txe/YoeB family addiction module toxin [Lacticaseibacillus sharpeae]